MTYEWRDMGACAGAVPMALSRRRFQTCANPVDRDSPETVPLCSEHLIDLQAAFLEPVLAKIQAATQGLQDAYDRGVADEVQRRLDIQQKQEELDAARRDAGARVYFLRCGGFIKIGFTTNLHSRIDTITKSGGVLMPDGLPYWTAELATATPGGMDDEKGLHKRFHHLRHTGEWFTEAPELTEYIDSIAQQETNHHERRVA